ncbi:MAG: translation initiation factor 2 [Desulfovibrio sp.]|nr:translation initiation factor 2 [Desulfovibrio sp.]
MHAVLSVFLLSFTLFTAGCAASDENTGEPPQPVAASPASPEPGAQPVAAKDQKPESAKKNKGASSAKGRKSEEQIHSELNDVARKLTGQAARTVRPSRSAKAVKKAGKEEHVASFVEVDTVDVTTEMRPAKAPGLYVGIIRYTEKLYECRGVDQKAALAAPCREVGKSNRTEMIMFDGKAWRY